MSEAGEEVKVIAESIIATCKAVEWVAIGIASAIALVVALLLGKALWLWIVAHWQQVAALGIMNAMFVTWAYLNWSRDNA
jgi:hypothetical protein